MSITRFAIRALIYLPIILYCIAAIPNHAQETTLIEQKLGSFLKNKTVSIDSIVLYSIYTQLFLAILGIFNYGKWVHKFSVLILLAQLSLFSKVNARLPASFDSKGLAQFLEQFNKVTEIGKNFQLLLQTLMTLGALFMLIGD